MAKTPKAAGHEGPSHYRFKVKSPIFAAGTQFNPGTLYTVKADVYEQVKAVAISPQPINKE